MNRFFSPSVRSPLSCLGALLLLVLLLMSGGMGQAAPAHRSPLPMGRSFLSTQPGSRKTSMEKTILNLEQKWQEALLASDVEALDRIYAETLVYTHSNASVDTKATYLDSIRSGRSRYLSLERDDIRVQIHGETAVVTCHWKVQSIGNGKRHQTDARYIHVYVQQQGTWRMVAHQSTIIAP
ncbi:MAG: nuclear transport factor 2 family protein [Blastocatellia bacterium]